MSGKSIRPERDSCDQYAANRSLSGERIKRGPVAVIECNEEIPCNPCQDCCPQKSISLDDSIISIPKLDSEKCNGCGICIPTCPGLAIFVVDGSYSETEGLISIPYEYLPLPKEGQAVDVTDRKGKIISKGQIFKVKTTKKSDHTAVVVMKVPHTLLMEARGFRFEEGDESYGE